MVEVLQAEKMIAHVIFGILLFFEGLSKRGLNCTGRREFFFNIINIIIQNIVITRYSMLKI